MKSEDNSTNSMNQVVGMIIDSTLSKHNVSLQPKLSPLNMNQLMDTIKILERQSQKYLRNAERRKEALESGAKKIVPQKKNNEKQVEQ